LDGDQVILYRDDWNQIIAHRRAAIDARVLARVGENVSELKSLTTTLDILKERQQFELLAMEYDALGNTELRDKYIELALQADNSDDTVITLRSMQGRRDLIPAEAVAHIVQRRKRNKDWSQLARLYAQVDDHRNAVINYCRTISESLKEGNIFSAAYYLKELAETRLDIHLFETAYRHSTESGDLWWSIRALQELDWSDELKAVLLAHRAEIENSGDSSLLIELYRVTGETEKLYELLRKGAEGMRIVRVPPPSG